MSTPLQDTPLPTRLRLALLWCSLMFCYLYGDYFGLFVPGTLQSMLHGQMGPLGATTQGVLIGTGLLMAVPSLMVILSACLPAAMCRGCNVVLGIAYAGIMALSMPGSWRFYQMFGVIEIVLSLSITWQAWRWPRQAGSR